MFLILFYLISNSSILGLPFCYNTSEIPKNFKIDNSFTIDPIKFNDQETTSFKIGNRIMTRNEYTGYGGSSYYNNSLYCPQDFIIPKKEDYESIISQLGDKAYSVFTDKNGFNMKKGLHYLSTTRGTKDTYFSFYVLYLNGNKIEISDMKISTLPNITIRCILKYPETKIEYPGVESDFDLKTSYLIKNNGKYFNGYLWRIDDKLFDTKNVTYAFNISGNHRVEFWGHFMTGHTVYVCRYAYVKKKDVSKKQDYNYNNVKLIETNFDMHYIGLTNFYYANAAVAPKINGEYLVAVSDKLKFIHILQFDRNDNLIKDLNTTNLGFPHDIVETDYGYVLYAEHDDYFRSYLNLYNKKFELINTVKVMNNDKKKDNRKIPSNPTKQIMKYDNKGSPSFGMDFMGEPSTGKLVYTKGRIYLIFGHYCYTAKDNGHNGDTTVTFNDVLKDIDFGETWGSSHSLLQSATFDENYFVTAALSDPGLDVFYTSKTEFDLDWIFNYDAVAKRYNVRKVILLSKLAGRMTGKGDGSTDARLGGILYFEKLKLYCLVYAKTPNYSNDNRNNTNIIYLTTWNFENDKLKNNITREIKIFPKDKNVLQVRCGKFGEDKIFIIYNETNQMIGYNYKVTPGNVPKVYIIQLNPYKVLQQDITIDKLYMNSNEDLRTFHDGVLIWASSNKEGKLVINKIGTPRLDDSFDDIDYILSKDDLKEEGKKEEEKGIKWYTILGIVIGVLILVIGAFILYKYIRRKKYGDITDLKDVKGSLLK